MWPGGEGTHLYPLVYCEMHLWWLFTMTLSLPGACLGLSVTTSEMSPRIFSLPCLSGSPMVMATNYSIKNTLKNRGLYSPSSKVLLAAQPQSSSVRALA